MTVVSAVMVMVSPGLYSVPLILQALNCLLSGAVKAHSGRVKESPALPV